MSEQDKSTLLDIYEGLYRLIKYELPDIDIDETYSWETSRTMIGALLTHTKKTDTTEQDLTSINDGFAILKKISMNYPHLDEDLRRAAGNIAMGVFGGFFFGTVDKTGKEIEAFRALDAKNRAKNLIISKARRLASELWKLDVNKIIRIGAMADQVYRSLAADGHTEQLPETVDRVREWIKPVAPDYASKGGRTKKKPHNRNG